MLRYKDGVFVRVGGIASLDKLARANAVDAAFLRLLQLFLDTGQDISPNGSNSYAPKKISEHPQAEGFSKKDYADAMQRMLEAKRIAIVKVGPRSKPVSRLVITEKAGE